MPFFTSCPGRSHLFGWEMGDVGHKFGLAVKEEEGAFLGGAERADKEGYGSFSPQVPSLVKSHAHLSL